MIAVRLVNIRERHVIVGWSLPKKKTHNSVINRVLRSVHTVHFSLDQAGDQFTNKLMLLKCAWTQFLNSSVHDVLYFTKVNSHYKGQRNLRWPNTVFNCVSFNFFSKTLDPYVTKNGSKWQQKLRFFDSSADVCVVAMSTSININSPLKFNNLTARTLSLVECSLTYLKFLC